MKQKELETVINKIGVALFKTDLEFNTLVHELNHRICKDQCSFDFELYKSEQKAKDTRSGSLINTCSNESSFSLSKSIEI